MSKISVGPEGYTTFWCPGCQEKHALRVRVEGGRRPSWEWNGSVDAPTFTPSVLVRVGHFAEGWTQGDKCWCTWAAEHPGEEPSFECSQCHSYVTNGSIQFLADCSHSLAGQTVPLPERDAWPT